MSQQHRTTHVLPYRKEHGLLTDEIADLDPSGTQGYIAACRIMEIPMDRSVLDGRQIAVLLRVQGDSGPECLLPTGATKALESVPKIGSKVWPVAPAIHAKSIKESQASRSVHPSRTADTGFAPRSRHPRDQIRRPAGRQNDEARAVGDQMQASQPLLGRPVHTAVARNQPERTRLPADQRNLHEKCVHVAASGVAIP